MNITIQDTQNGYLIIDHNLPIEKGQRHFNNQYEILEFILKQCCKDAHDKEGNCTSVSGELTGIEWKNDSGYVKSSKRECQLKFNISLNTI